MDIIIIIYIGFPGGASGKEPTCQCRRHKKDFLSDQCKEIEEKNRMGKIRDLFKKIRDTKGTFYAKMGSKWYGPNRSRRY